MNKSYDPTLIEQRWYQHWEKNHYFSPSDSGKPWCIMMPPPNVTGSLHMGHGFGFTLMDVLTRYHRMCGDNVLWQPGTDHAGIATQMVVERQLEAQGHKKNDMGREAFLEKIWEWKNQSGGRITQQLRRLGASPDWTRERFTLDDNMNHAVRECFIRLFDEGLIYRGSRLVNWDPKMLTAISDLEVVSEEENTHLWHIRYPVADSKDSLIVATTRPETMLGDVAVAVHPEDVRYRHLIGQFLTLPLTDRKIPVIADDYVDMTFGSGCVKITPAHDFNDYAIGQRHGLAPINIFTPDAHLNENTPALYKGMERFAARKKIIEDLESLDLLVKTDKYRTKIPRGEKSGVIVEPRITQQWFMKMQGLAAPAIEAVKTGKIRFTPENWQKTWFQWLENIEDWCISRQLWWGHRIPVWYDNEGRPYAGHTAQDVRQKYTLTDNIALHQDEDVLDTWFSSALWPFSTLGWPTETPELKTFYPTQVLVTGFDIIFFWVARMVMMGLKFTGEVPFRDIFITGLIRDHDGHKMSKSKGNVLDPIDLIDGISLDALLKKRTTGLMQPAMAPKIEKATRKEFPEGIQAYGTDALRFTFCALASQNREIRFDTGRLGGYRNFCNKLWNAARFVLMNTQNKDCSGGEQSIADRWILSRLQQTIQSAHESIALFRFDLLAQTLYEFVWNQYCDWYLELSKTMMTGETGTEAQQAGTRHTLITVLQDILRLLQPVTPFITEEIWQLVAPVAGSTLMQQPYPVFNAALSDPSVDREISRLQEIVTAIRTLRSEMNIAPSKTVSLLLQNGSTEDKKLFENHGTAIQALAKISSFSWPGENETLPESITTTSGTLDLRIPMTGLVDYREEHSRLSRDIEKMSADITRMAARLDNPDFVARAPAAVVEKDKARLSELTDARIRLEKQLEKITVLSSSNSPSS